MIAPQPRWLGLANNIAAILDQLAPGHLEGRRGNAHAINGDFSLFNQGLTSTP